MADEPGRLSLGFSVTPDELTVVTDQGHTVTLIDTGVELVDSYRTIVARATNGEKYPIVVNESQSHAAIGANWQHDEGGNPNADGRDYVKIIDDQGAYVNVQLINWLMQFGASFRATFLDVYIKNGTGHEESALVNYSCHIGDIMQINSYSGTRTSFIYDDADEHLINCAGDGYSDTTHLPDDYKVSKNPSDTDAYNNYWVLKALGVPMTIVPDFTSVMAVTSDGQTVTLVGTAVRSIGGVNSIVLVDSNGDEWPLCVNQNSNTKFVNEQWVCNAGGNIQESGVDYIAIMRGGTQYVNSGIMLWLVEHGATFEATFDTCYVTKEKGSFCHALAGIGCDSNNSMEIGYYGGNTHFNIYKVGDNYQINCTGTGISEIEKTSENVPVSTSTELTNALDNYNVLKALGVPMSYVES